jgi:hypothetical protein
MAGISPRKEVPDVGNQSFYLASQEQRNRKQRSGVNPKIPDLAQTW